MRLGETMQNLQPALRADESREFAQLLDTPYLLQVLRSIDEYIRTEPIKQTSILQAPLLQGLAVVAHCPFLPLKQFDYLAIFQSNGVVVSRIQT